MSPKTTFLGRRIGYNEEKRKRTRAMKIKNGAKKSLGWFKRRGWIIGLVLAILATLAWTNRFYLQRFNPMELRHLQYIDIEGNRMLTWEDVVQNAQVEPGMLLSEVFEDSVEKNLMQLPLIHKVTVEKHFPSSLTIKVQESSPVVAYFQGSHATVYSERGLLLPMSTSTAFHLPVSRKVLSCKSSNRKMPNFTVLYLRYPGAKSTGHTKCSLAMWATRFCSPKGNGIVIYGPYTNR